MLHAATGAVTLITQPWVFALAQERLSYSADGTSHALVQQDDKQKLQIFNESMQYGTVRKVTALGGDITDPAWSPTGQWIAFVSTETGGDEMYRVDPAGAIAQRLTVNTWEWDKHPTWSPDGSQIVFFSNRDSGRRQLWIMDADGGNQRNLSSNEYNDCGSHLDLVKRATMDSMNLQDYLRPLLRWWWLLALAALVGAASNFVMVQLEPLMYRCACYVDGWCLHPRP